MEGSSAKDEPTHRAQATIDLSAIRSNVEVLRAAASGAELLAVGKADAYGQGHSRLRHD